MITMKKWLAGFGVGLTLAFGSYAHTMGVDNLMASITQPSHSVEYQELEKVHEELQDSSWMILQRIEEVINIGMREDYDFTQLKKELEYQESRSQTTYEQGAEESLLSLRNLAQISKLKLAIRKAESSVYSDESVLEVVKELKEEFHE